MSWTFSLINNANKFYIVIRLHNNMTNIETKIKNSEKWKKACKNLEKFNEIIKLIEQYPLKKRGSTPPCQPYKPSNYCLVF